MWPKCSAGESVPSYRTPNVEHTSKIRLLYTPPLKTPYPYLSRNICPNCAYPSPSDIYRTRQNLNTPSWHAARFRKRINFVRYGGHVCSGSIVLLPRKSTRKWDACYVSMSASYRMCHKTSSYRIPFRSTGTPNFVPEKVEKFPRL